MACRPRINPQQNMTRPIHNSLTASTGAIALIAATLLLSGGMRAAAQANEWTWVNGTDTGNRPGVYGVLGSPSATSMPGSRRYAAGWTDKSGNFWVFGGDGYDANGIEGELNDLWEFFPATNEWAWMGGGNSLPCGTGGCSAFAGEYGELGIAAPVNYPGSRTGGTTWTDASGNLWLFGGDGYDSQGNNGFLNDLWEYKPSTNLWTWMGGSNELTCIWTIGGYCGVQGVYGSEGMASDASVPGGRMGAVGWTDADGNLWLFGGENFVEIGVSTYLNDLWKYNPSTQQWAWMSGSAEAPCPEGVACNGASGIYGAKGTPAPANVPGARWFSTAWTDAGGNLWLFGGEGLVANGGNDLDDMWVFVPSTNEWTWMGGSNEINVHGGQPGVYGSLGTPAPDNIPGGRKYASSWTDSAGNFWLMGGEGYDVNDGLGYLNDLWEFSPGTNTWTWSSGSSKGNSEGFYGDLDQADAENAPPSRELANLAGDGSGNLLLFGGMGKSGHLNDTWRYQISAPTVASLPAFSMPSGSYHKAITVRIGDGMRDAAIHYTVDGSTPTQSSALYTAPIPIAKTTVLKAIASVNGLANSAVAERVYAIQQSQSIHFVAMPASVTYGVKAIELSARATSGLAVTFSVLSGPAHVNGSLLTVTGAGKVTVAANQTGSSSYQAAPEVTQGIEVQKATLTVTARNLAKTYGKPHPPFTYSITGFVRSDSQAGVVKGAPAISTTANLKSPAGVYPIPVTNGTLSAANYKFRFVPGTLTVTKATLTVAAKDLTMKQGSLIPALKYTMSGFANGETQGSVTGQPKLTTNATSTSRPGLYSITVGSGNLTAKNYRFTFKAGTLTITP